MNNTPWYRPIFSPEQGILLVLGGSFLCGAALVRVWNGLTDLALLCTLLALQAEHPLILQIKQRSSIKPRLVFWSSFYGGSALAIAGYLYLRQPWLGWIFALAFVALLIDAIAVWQHRQKSIANEFIGFAAVCLASLLAYGVNASAISASAIAMWLLNTLFFASAIFTMKLRKKKTSNLAPCLIYHFLASTIVLGIFLVHGLAVATAAAFALALLKLMVILCRLQWYRTARFEFIARLETYFALTFISVAAIGVLPARL